MLYDPKWNKKTEEDHILSLDTLIAWAKSKDPSERYEFGDCRGMCFFSQYLNSFTGYENHLRVDIDREGFEVWQALHFRYSACVNMESTFGDAVANLESIPHVLKFQTLYNSELVVVPKDA